MKATVAKRVGATLVGGCVAAAIAFAAMPQAGVADEKTADPLDISTEAGTQKLQELQDNMSAQHEQYGPLLTVLADGTLVQRTPDDSADYFQFYGTQNTDYNSFYLNADARGCNSCHEDLATLVRGMNFYHVELSNGYGTDVSVMECRLCHDDGAGYVPQTKQLGTLIHGIHSKSTFTGDCMTCHTATSDGTGMQLWDEVKYDVMQGITAVAAEDVTAEFSYDQDVVTDMFAESWWYTDTNANAIGNEEAGVEVDEQTMLEWTITVDGMVDNPFTMTMAELIDQAPSETFISTNQCIMNPPGGEQIANVEVTGIPMSWLLEKAGVQEGATVVMSTAPDGWNRGTSLDLVAENGGYLVYKMNGELLDWNKGFPVTTWLPGQAAPAMIRWVSELTVTDEDFDSIKYWSGWKDPETGEYTNKPNAGILHLHEGQVVAAGEEYTFEGYADGFNEKVVAVEFSLDNGASWVSYDTSDSDFTKWVYWNFKFTPEVGAYTLSVRAVTESGLVSVTPDQCMFVAK